jgi:hypothetical protein
MGLKLLYTKVLHALTDAAFNAILKDIGLNLSFYKIKKKIQSIVPIFPILIDTCMNSCIAFTGNYKGLQHCPLCNEKRYNENGKPINITYFFSLKDRLKIQYANKERAQELRYRSKYFESKENLDSFADIYDGKYV